MKTLLTASLLDLLLVLFAVWQMPPSTVVDGEVCEDQLIREHVIGTMDEVISTVLYTWKSKREAGKSKQKLGIAARTQPPNGREAKALKLEQLIAESLSILTAGRANAMTAAYAKTICVFSQEPLDTADFYLRVSSYFWGEDLVSILHELALARLIGLQKFTEDKKEICRILMREKHGALKKLAGVIHEAAKSVFEKGKSQDLLELTSAHSYPPGSPPTEAEIADAEFVLQYLMATISLNMKNMQASFTAPELTPATELSSHADFIPMFSAIMYWIA